MAMESYIDQLIANATKVKADRLREGAVA